MTQFVRVLPYEILVFLTNFIFFCRNETIPWGKKRTALFQTHNWEKSKRVNNPHCGHLLPQRDLSKKEVFSFLIVVLSFSSQQKMVFLGLCPKPVTPPLPLLGHLGLSLSIFVEKVVFKAKNTHFGNFRTPANPPI